MPLGRQDEAVSQGLTPSSRITRSAANLDTSWRSKLHSPAGKLYRTPGGDWRLEWCGVLNRHTSGRRKRLDSYGQTATLLRKVSTAPRKLAATLATASEDCSSASAEARAS